MIVFLRKFLDFLSFFFIFFIRDVSLGAYFFKRASDWIQGVHYYWKAISYRQNRQKQPSQVLKNLLNGTELYEMYFFGIWKNI